MQSRDTSKGPRIAAAVHLYDGRLWPELAACIRRLPAGSEVFVTVPQDSSNDRLVLVDFPSAKIIRVPNVGRDIAPFIALLPELQKFDLVCKLHGKRDIAGSGKWRRTLLKGVAGSRKIVSLILQAFENNPEIVLAGAKRFYLNGARNVFQNRENLEKYEPDLPDHYGFFGGTVFWLRPSLVADFPDRFSTDDFVLHADDDGQLEHAVERLFGIRAANSGGAVAVVDPGWFGKPRLTVVPANGRGEANEKS